ncbi:MULTISPECIES: MBL fold metallo-hydrolase [unclassified Streptomyces]|uniref:MBL fold metallo-hydrolase n=1 Tax=unclassified Streptomyces TaxID=2593676 RepID=UPI00081D9347|nr:MULTISPECIES: MBL fold metallo-hydrolase [unclassified Streptomyces]MYZ38299.1 MBL fold metallo-hydrolase [Streptomyces sp. SID4917]SCF97621.1 Glyoxylase, beta-lactamase superfamily II [Streptomyces sp. MnatMP-M17]
MDLCWEEHGWERLGAGVGRRRLPRWDATAGLVVGADAVLLYDTGSTVREGAELGAEVRALLGGGRHVTHIALSHPHFDHVLGTAAFPEAEVEVYGAVGMARLMAAGGPGPSGLYEEAVRLGADAEETARAVEALVPPRHEVSGLFTLELGGDRRAVLVNAGPGHTAHDLAVLVAEASVDASTGTSAGASERASVARSVVFCGDLVEESGEPQAGPDAIPARWPAALDRLLALGGEDAAYVPGHGAVVDAAFVRAQRDALAARFGVS